MKRCTCTRNNSNISCINHVKANQGLARAIVVHDTKWVLSPVFPQDPPIDTIVQIR